MNNHIPLRVSIHCGRSNIMAAQTIVRPKLFPRKTHVGIARDRIARLGRRSLFCFRVRKQSQARADEEYEESCEETATQHSNHIAPLLRTLWLFEKTERSCCALRWACPTHTRLSLQCWGLASNRGQASNGFPKDRLGHSDRDLGGPSGRSVRGSLEDRCRVW